MSEEQKNYSGGVGFFGLLTLLFIGLKLGNVIAWSWFWVLSPIIFLLGFMVVLAFIAAIIVALGK